jgi:TolB protein
MRAARAIRAALTVALVAATWAALAPLAAADDLRPAVVVTPGASQQYGAALQVFADRSATPDPQRAGAFRRAIADALEFSNVFEILDPEAFLGPTSTMSLDAPPPICSDWTVIGADALVEGELQIDGTQASAEFRLWDVARCRRLARKRYRQAGDDPNVIARRIADDIMAAFIGVRGVSSTEIAFVSDRSGSTEIYVMGADGEKPRPATSNRSINNFPDWSPSGDSIVYTSYQRNNRPALYLSTRRGNSPGPVLRDLNGTHQYRGVFDPMGKMMAVVLSKQGAADIYTVRPSGRRLKRITRSPAIDISPTWSPDGKQIAFVSDRTGAPQIYVMDSDGDNVRRLTYDGTYNTAPAWSPDGKWIAYESRLEGQFDLWLIDPDGSVNVPLISHPRSDESPAWAPNGRKIAFSSKRRGRADIYVVDINGEGLRRLTRNAGSNKSPAWGPFPR